jgi:hypothetical protein
MKKKRIVSQFFDDAKFNELISLNEANVNDEKISKNLEFDTKTNYDRMLHLWNEWIFVFCFDDFVSFVSICWKHFSWVKYERRNVDVNSCDLKIAKHFMKSIVRDSFIERKKAFIYIMLQKWTNFDVDWKRRFDNVKISFEVSKSIYFVWVFINTIYSYYFYVQILTIMLIHWNEITKKFQTFYRATCSSFYNSESFYHFNYSHVKKELMSIQTFSNFCAKSRIISAFYLLFFKSEKVYRI